MAEHPKGIEYAHLLSEFDRYPIILDAENNVLSFPPIINGDHTTVTKETKDFFIDVTGWDIRACESSLMLIALQLQEYGGIIETVEVTNCFGAANVYPNGSAVEHKLTIAAIQGLLGGKLTEEAISGAINPVSYTHLTLPTT